MDELSKLLRPATKKMAEQYKKDVIEGKREPDKLLDTYCLYLDADEELTLLKAELIKERAEKEDYKEVLRDLGHHGIDFGYGKVKHEVAKMAQEVLGKYSLLDY